MYSNHLKIAFRNLRRNSVLSVINISGLAVGLATCWIIALFVSHEKSYDKYLPDADRICAVAIDLKMGDQEGMTTNTPPPVGPRLAADFPEIEMTARTFPLRSIVVRRDMLNSDPLLFNESLAMAVDTNFMELFRFPLIEGDISSALDKPGSLVLTEETAQKYFGDVPAMGQTLQIDGRVFSVSAIAKNLPSTSTMQFDLLLPIADFKVVDRFSWSWVWLQVDTWVKLKQKPTTESLQTLEAKFPAMVRAHAPAAYERIGQDFEEQLRKGDRFDVKLLPLKSLHLDEAQLSSRLMTLGDRQQVRIFSTVGILILLLACVNFMNLTTARSMKRAREVGVRKVLGSQRIALISQFLTEAMLYSSAAMLLAATLVNFFLPMYNKLTGLELITSDVFSAKIIGLVLLLPVVTGLLGGLYPALYLSKFSTSEIFKNAVGTGKGGHANVRSGLVIFQFTVSVVLMLGSYIVYRQLNFAQHESPGLQRENVLVIPNATHIGGTEALEAFRHQLLQMPEAKDASWSTFLPSIGSFGDSYEPEQGNQDRTVVKNLPLSSFMTDVHFASVLGLELFAGRNFHSDGKGDSTSVILNEAAVKAIGWDDAIGKWMRYPGNQYQRFQVIGVMRDFHINSVRIPIEPVALFHESSKTYQTWGSYITVRLQEGTEQAAVAKASALWKAAVPGIPFEYDFLDDSFARLYQAEVKTGSVLGIFTVLALFIGCLGLFALAVFTAEQRTKEIGIRKVLGASAAGVTALLTKNFLKLVLISILLASPIAYYFVNKWLMEFEYRIDLEWWMFVGVGVISLLIAFISVSMQSIRAALANPVESLRSE